jgi:hypothetical protein
VKRGALILLTALAVWLGTAVALRARVTLDATWPTVWIALCTAIPVAYAAVYLLLAPKRDRLHGWSVALRLGLTVAALAVCALSIVLGGTSDVPGVALVIVPFLLLGNVRRLGPEAAAAFRQRRAHTS